MTFRAFRRWLPGVGLLATMAGGAARAAAASEATNDAPCAWTLPAAIDYALAHNRAIEARRLGLESRQVGAGAAADSYRWTLRPLGGAEARDDGRYIDAGLSAVRATEAGTVLSAGPRFQQTTLDNAPDVNEGRVAIEVRQPLLRRGGRLVNAEPLVRASREVQTARRELELQRADIVLRVVELHEELFRLQRRFTNDTAAVSRMDAFLRLTRARDRQGRAARGDTLRAEIAGGTIHQQRADTAARLTARRAELADLLGLPPSVPFDALPGPRFVVSAPAADEAAAIALSNRLDYAQILQDIDDARRGVRIARQTLLPDIELVSRYERQGQGDTASAAMSLDHNAWMVGVRLLSDFPPRAERRALSQAEITERVARLRSDTVQSAIRLQVLQALDVLHRSDDELPLAGTTLAAARQRLELMRRLYSSARATTFDVADAETQWREADERWLAASSAVTVAAYRLLWTLGTLTDVPNCLKSGSEPAP